MTVKAMADRRQQTDLWMASFFAVLIGAVAISSQSLWIDEGGTAYKAIQPTLRSWWGALIWERNSNMQLPLYLLYTWAWEKLFGSSELALRAANFPPLLVCVGVLRYLFSSNRRRFFFSVLFLLTSPFVWFYLNEARPYIFLLASSLALFAAVAKPALEPSVADEPGSSWFNVLAYSSIAVTATSVLAAIWVPFSFLAAWYCIGQRFWKLFVSRAPLAFSLMIVGHGLCSAFYSWTLSLGTGIPHFGQNLIASIFHSCYELFGFAGLGPGRLDLRGLGQGALRPYFIPLALLALAWLLVLFFGFPHFKTKRWNAKTLAILGFLFAPPIVVFAVGYHQHVRVSPRYLTPAFPLILIGQAIAADTMWTHRLRKKMLITLFTALLLVSSLEVRFAGRHAKEDYRHAAAFAKEAIARNSVVFWAADVQTAIYYDVIDSNQRDTGSSQIVLYTQHDAAQRLGHCDIVILSRSDIYDIEGTRQKFVRDRQFRIVANYQGFVIYSGSDAQSKPNNKS